MTPCFNCGGPATHRATTTASCDVCCTNKSCKRNPLAKQTPELSPDVLRFGEFRRRIRRWLTSTFGADFATDRRERAARIVEEAVELAQAEGVGAAAVARIARRVYSRPKGEPRQEAAGVGVCLIAYADAAGLNLDGAIGDELDRVERLPAEKFRAKQAEKAAAGTAKGLGPTPPVVVAFTPFRGYPTTILGREEDSRSALLDAIVAMLKHPSGAGR